VNSDSVVLLCPTFSHISPVSVLFSEVETGGVGNEDPSDNPSGESKPADDPESSVGTNVVVDDCGQKSTNFTGRSGQSVGGGSNGNRENLGGDEEGGTVGPELLEK
jgi:hypothetical protein